MSIMENLNCYLNDNWHLKFVGLPLSFIIGLGTYKIVRSITLKKCRAQLYSKVVVITGASSGIGEALAHTLYEQGCKVILAARRESELQRVKQDLLSKKLPHEDPIVLTLDLADLDSIEPFVAKIYELCGHIDIVINNGGVSHRGAALHTKTDVDKQIMYINYFGSVYLTKAVLPKMVEQKSGHIVFISSVQGRVAIPDRSAYAASKHAMQAFGDCLRAEMQQHNINVSVVSPGYIKTAISLNALTTASNQHHGVMDKSTAAGFTAEYTAEKIVDMIALKDDELIICQLLPRVAMFIRYMFPSLYFRLAARRANKTL